MSPQVTYLGGTHTIAVEDAYKIKNELKTLGFRFDSISTDWTKRVSSLDEAIEVLAAVRELGAQLPEKLEKFIPLLTDAARPESNRETIKNVVLKSALSF